MLGLNQDEAFLSQNHASYGEMPSWVLMLQAREAHQGVKAAS